MGLEIGWHLRFARSDELAFRIDAATVGQVRNHIGPDSGWRYEAGAEEGGVLTLTFHRVP